MHTPHGILMTVFIILNPHLGWSWLGMCIFYQIIEEWRIEDHSYLDVRGYLVGMPIGAVLYWIGSVLKDVTIEFLLDFLVGYGMRM